MRKSKAQFPLLLVMMLLASALAAQSDIPVGQWRTHFNYEQSYHVVRLGSKVYSNAFHSVLELDLANQVISKLTKGNVLSDVGITAIGADPASGTLILGYTNGNIDLVTESETINMAVLKNENMTSSKRINSIVVAGESFFAATPFGMLEIDINTQQVVSTLSELGRDGTSVGVLDGGTKGDTIWLATTKGLLAANFKSGVNLLDFRNWKRTLESAGQVDFIEASTEILYAGTRSGRLWANAGSGWSELAGGTPTEFLVLYDGELFYGKGNQLHARSSDGQVNQITLGLNTDVRGVVFDGEDIWLADQNNGLARRNDEGIRFYTLNGPEEKEIYKIKSLGNTVATLSGGYEPNGLIPYNRAATVSVFGQQGWNEQPIDVSGTPTDAADVVATNGADDLYLALYGQGIYSSGTGELIDSSTPGSLLMSSEGFVPVTAIANSTEGDLVVSSNQASGKYMVLRADGSWESLGFIPVDLPAAISMKQNSFGDFWAVMPHSSNTGLLVFNIESSTYRLVNAGAGLPSSTVYDVSFDRDDYAWVATAGGVAIIANTYEIFDPVDLLVTYPVAENSFVLNDEAAYTVTTDGANRKWVGTDKGLFLLDEFGAGTLTNYTVENSPLPSNEVRQVAINHESGEVFVLTDEGLVSFRAGVTEPVAAMQKAKVFPNPVNPGFNGVVAIEGLAFDTIVKITDEAGRLVREMVSTGGLASWDLLDLRGQRVQSGIYIIFAATRDGSQSVVGKVAVIN